MDSSGKRIARTLLQIDVDLGMLRQECGQGSGLQPRDRARCRRKPRRDRHRRGRGQSRQRTSIQKRQFAGHHTTQARQIEALVEQPGGRPKSPPVPRLQNAELSPGSCSSLDVGVWLRKARSKV